MDVNERSLIAPKLAASTIRGITLRHSDIFERLSLNIDSWCIPTLIARFMGPTWAHLGPTGPRWASCWPYELCYLGTAHSVLWILFLFQLILARFTKEKRYQGTFSFSTQFWVSGSTSIGIFLLHQVNGPATKYMHGCTMVTTAVKLPKKAVNLITHSLSKTQQQRISLQWRHNERDSVSNHRRLGWFRNRLFRRRSKKTRF